MGIDGWPLVRFPSKEEDCRGFPLFSVATSANMFRSKDEDVSMVDASSVVEVGSMLSMTSTTANAAREGEGSTSTGGGGGGDPLIMQRPSSSMRYKGVVLQQNGHWGAQIYAHHHRIWLGTFKSELAAAAAYDSAAIKLRRGNSHRNLHWKEFTVHEPHFQEQFSTEEVLEMIKNGSYESRFAEYTRVMQSTQASPIAPPRGSPRSGISSGCNDGASIICCEMFTKELTPSDVGKLNRLVIPKKHATRFFPEVSPESEDELLLEFRDPENRLSVFRYCYWKSSQSYVFTKGWNKFVKEKRLQAKDSVTFYRCEEREGLRRTYCMIKTVPYQQGRGQENGNVTIGLGLSYKREVDEEEEVISGPMTLSGVTEGEQEKKRVKIFGVWVS